MNEMDLLKVKYPIYFDNGRKYAETWYNSLLKYEKHGLLKQMLGIETLPKGAENIRDFIEKKAILNASNLCIRDLNESDTPEPEYNLKTFLLAFKKNLEELMSDKS